MELYSGKRALSFIALFLFSFSLFALDFTSIKENDSQKKVFQLMGKPLKIVKSTAGDSEIDIWLDNKDIWLITISNGMVSGQPTKIEELLTGLLNLKDNLSNAANLLNSDLTKYSDIGESVNKNNEEINIDSIKSKIDVSLISCEVITTWQDKQKIGYRLKIKNNSEVSISFLTVTISFYDNNGKVFFKDTCSPVNTVSFSGNQEPLESNFSRLYPNDEDIYSTVNGIDISEWDGKTATASISKIELAK